MSDAQLLDLVIVGGGPGGLSAGIYAMRAALNTLLIERSAPGGQINLSDQVENYPGFTHIGGGALSNKFLEHANDYRLPIINAEVAVIEPGMEFHTVRTVEGHIYRTHAIIMAMGGSPRKLGVPGETEMYGRGVSYCAVCDGFFFKKKRVIVVGGGDSACEEGLYLAKLAEKVFIVHRRDTLRASMILRQRVAAECKMEVLWNSVIDEILADSGGVNGVRLKDTRSGAIRELPIDGIFVFIGFTPNTALVPAGIRLSADGFVITDERCATSIPGIYAIGDLREKYARQIVLAAADGCMAALAAAHYVESRKAKMADSCELPTNL
jgi:thioredoxin reductase (NADPH)